MEGTEGLKVWVTNLLSYDKFGKATVIYSFCKIAEDSQIKGFAKKFKKKPQKQSTQDFGEQSLF